MTTSVSILVASLAMVALLSRGDAAAQSRTIVAHTHQCPCWQAGDSTSSQQLCSCGVVGHTSGAYGVECASDAASFGSVPDGGGAPVGAAPSRAAPKKIKPVRRLDCLRYPTAPGCQ